ncbi:hypothetical protein MGYG_01334 [Nannizzia gypsea CBS 118893]|uniref:Uncharacterized protein n=1 Tax=Arthroderma gypseum (strain ATCC MYA-4604 / CBS 118893) TaxID=535722 RepID=E5R0A5_ARTGP|nr:hypothetical protein MGYG_01334 [Nannizzia gypsea CBS 118893]EFQ98301.1 hypothetical protein MGYG_01334 [Nannizzia gypsea CBS 118893]
MSQSEQYWLPGYELSRQVILSNIHIFLGPTASARPYTYHGRDGYLVTGNRLTQQQIDDLKSMSKKFELDQTIKTMQLSSSYEEAGDPATQPSIHKPVPVSIPRGRERNRERERGREHRSYDRGSRSRRYRC